MGITKTCSSSTWYRQQVIPTRAISIFNFNATLIFSDEQIKTVFTNDIQGFALTDKTRRDNIVERVTVNSVSREIVYRDFNRLSTEVIFSLPL